MARRTIIDRASTGVTAFFAMMYGFELNLGVETFGQLPGITGKAIGFGVAIIASGAVYNEYRNCS